LNLIAEKDYAMSMKSSIPIEKMRVRHHFHKDLKKILLISYPGRSFSQKAGKVGENCNFRMMIKQNFIGGYWFSPFPVRTCDGVSHRNRTGSASRHHVTNVAFPSFNLRVLHPW